MNETRRGLKRRDFLQRASAALGAAALPWMATHASAAPGGTQLQVGEGVVDITPPVGIELAGFHRPPDKPRLATSIRQPSTVRALVLALGDTRAAIVSMDMMAVSAEFAGRVQAGVERQTGIPAANVRVMATHTHSMPTLKNTRQWGRVPVEYAEKVEAATVQAVQTAKDDLAPAELLLGKARADGGSFNRTCDTWKTEDQFDASSTDADRWLDRTLRALVFRRTGGKRDLLWYHFSAHPVCFTDEGAGPDWPGMVADLTLASNKLVPCFLQGHGGDVNPGIAKGFGIAKAEPTAAAIHKALVGAIDAARPVQVDGLRVLASHVDLPLDMARFAAEIEEYRSNPAACSKGVWVDAGFAEDWFAGAQKWDTSITTLTVPLSILQLGPIGMVFHPSELYSYYGLAMQRSSPFSETLCVGYTDDFVGYLPDPAAYAAGEYAALVVPKLVEVPPYTTEAARTLAKQGSVLLNQIAGKS